MSILITGATGYIGSHICVELLLEDYHIILLDNLKNSNKDVINRIEEISKKKVSFYNVDLLNIDDLEKVFQENDIKGVIHLAGFKAVGESVLNPLKYYKNNIGGLLNLSTIMDKYNVKSLVFSSSATVYGPNNKSPLTEDMPLSTTNPYGSTKMVGEQILKELSIADKSWSIVILRYFNPVGAHETGRLGENPKGIPNNLMPIINKVAIGKIPNLLVYGDDYETKDGTGIRDYIHIVDLAKGHIKALEKSLNSQGINIYNLGTGKGYSVLEVITSFEKVTGQSVPYEIVARRPGDIDECFADPSKAMKELKWKAERDLEAMCRDSWRWEYYNSNLI